jgi:hypothetical protein
MGVILAVRAQGYCETKVNKSYFSQFHAMSSYWLFAWSGNINTNKIINILTGVGGRLIVFRGREMESVLVLYLFFSF